METKQHGNTSSPGGVESADGGGAATDIQRIGWRDAISFAQAQLQEAESDLSYGNRQSAEAALYKVRAAAAFLSQACETHKGK